MNYNVSGTYMMILEIFTMFDTTKVEIKKEHQLLMVGETTSFKKGKGKKGYFKKNRKTVVAQVKKPKSGLSLKLSASTAKGMVTRSGTAPNTWRIRRMAK